MFRWARAKQKVCSFGSLVLMLTTFFSSLCGCADSSQKKTSNVGEGSSKALRIVSTAPSITETLFELKLGESVVAVSDYCKYPKETECLPKIGSLYNFNVEAIVELEPDFVVLLKENEVLAKSLEKFKIETVVVDHSSLEGVGASFEILGERAERGVVAKSGVRKQEGARERGRELRDKFQARIESARSSVANRPKPRVLISLYRTFGTKRLGEVYVAAQNPYFNEILEIVGATNCADSMLGAAPTINEEGILALNPDAIVDLSTDGTEYDEEERAAQILARRAEWETLGTNVEAVKEGRIYPIPDNFATVPGPRSIILIEKLVGLLRPSKDDGTL